MTIAAALAATTSPSPSLRSTFLMGCRRLMASTIPNASATANTSASINNLVIAAPETASLSNVHDNPLWLSAAMPQSGSLWC